MRADRSANRMPRRHSRTRCALWLLGSIVFLASGSIQAGLSQTPKGNDDPALIDAGHQLLAQLTFQRQHDTGVFIAFGIPRATAALSAVMSRGLTTSATAEDWTNLHRSLDALIELNETRGDFLRAALYANIQNFCYRNNEHDYSAALAASRQGLELQKRSRQTATLYLNWMNIGENLSSLGRFNEAVESFHQAQKILPDAASGNAANLGRDLVQAELAAHQVDAARADVAALLDHASDKPPLYQAKASMAQSDLFIENGNYGGVVDSVREALRRMRGQPKENNFSYEAASQLMTCVLASMNTLSYAEAIALAKRIDADFPSLPFPVAPFAEEAIRMRRRLSGDLGGLLRDDVARLDTARNHGYLPGQIEALQSLAVDYRAAHGNPQAILSLEEALSLEKSLMDSPGFSAKSVNDSYYLRILGSLGDAEVAVQDLGNARRCYNEMLQFIRAIPEMTLRSQENRFYAQAILGKARVAELDDDPDTAREILQDALKADSKSPGEFDRGDALLQWARMERTLGEEPAQAKKLYEETIAAYESERYRNWEMIARLEYARFLAAPPGGRLPNAAQDARADLNVLREEAQSAQFADAQWRILFIEGIIAESKGQFPEAIADYRKAVARLDEIRSGFSQEEERQSFMDDATIQELYQRLIDLLTRTGQPSQAWDYLERSKARAFLEMLRGQKFRNAASRPEVAQLRTMEKQITDLRAQLAPPTVAIVRGAGHDPEALHQELHQLEARFSLARQQSSLENSRAGQAYALLPAGLRETEKRLAPGVALVEYSLLPDALTAFIATRNGAEQMTWKANSQTLRRDVLELRALLADPTTGPQLGPLLESVSSVVLAPVLPHVPKSVRRLVIVPTDYLTYLPFQVLWTSKDRPLIEKYSIDYLPSASTLQFLRRGERLKADLFLGALGNTAVEGMAPLPGTLKETAAIARLYPNAARASGADFTHDRLEEALQRYPEVHLATHGLLDEEAPLFSAVLTSPAPHEPTRLSLYEITQMKLRARLVVLSACETGLGKLQRGDEVTGLTRTFLLAGADTVVSSLWKVSDESTALLMQGFYRHLRSGDSPATALRASALQVRKRYPHPFFWAPFIVTGAP